MLVRASRDVDVSIPVPFEAIPEILDQILARGLTIFTIRRRGQLGGMDRAFGCRAELNVRHAGQMLHRLDLDINGSEFEPSVNVVPSRVLTDLGFAGSFAGRTA